MKTEILRFLVCICFVILFVHVTVTPFVVARTIDQSTTQTELVCDSVKPSNAEITDVSQASGSPIYESK